MYNLVLMAGTNGEPYPADSTESPNPSGSGEIFESFDEYRRYEEPARDRGWSVVDVTPAYNDAGEGRGTDGGMNAPPPIPAAQRRPVRGENHSSSGNTGLIVAIAGVALLAVFGALALSWLAFNRASNTTSTDIATSSSPGQQNETTMQIQQTMQSLGLGSVVVEQRDNTIFLTGTVATEEERRSATSVASSLVGDLSLDASELAVAGSVSPSPDTIDPGVTADTAADVTALEDHPLGKELNRIVATRPIIFDTAQSALTPNHLDIIQSAAQKILEYPGVPVTIVGWSDGDGTAESNEKISLARANAVREALIASGVDESQLSVDARGEDGASNSKALGALERRVEFEVAPVVGGGLAAGSGETLRIGVVAPSPRDDVAFTQSMVDAVNLIAQERGGVEIDITDNTFIPEEAAAAVEGYANDDYDLIIAHGTQFGTELQDLVQANPDVAFAWGTSTENFGLTNLYAYSVESQEGGYVLGAMAGRLSQTGTVGLVGPIEIGDAAGYVNGFQKGAETEAGSEVLVEYVGSFSEANLAKEAASKQIADGADVLSGTAQLFTGAIEAAEEKGDVLWFGNQANQSNSSPDLVVASQVYHWEIILRQIVADIDRGSLAGRAQTLSLANNGLTIEYNPGFQGLPPEVKQLGDDVANKIRSGEITVSAGS